MMDKAHSINSDTNDLESNWGWDYLLDEKNITRITTEPYHRLENNTASYLFKDEFCVWGDDEILKIGAKVNTDDDPHAEHKMTTLNLTLDEAKQLANSIIETCYIIKEDRAKKYMEMIAQEAEKLDPETCDVWWQGAHYFDPYGLYGYRKSFVECDAWEKKVIFARNVGSKIAIMDSHIPKEKYSRISERLSEIHKQKSLTADDDNDWGLDDGPSNTASDW